MIRSGNGGYLVYGGTPNLTVHNSMWTLNLANRLAEVTNSSFGGSLYAATLQDPSWTMEVPRDDTLYPEALGFTQGVFIASLYFKIGAEAKCHRIDSTSIESVNYVCDQKGDVVRVSITGKGGMATLNVSVPV